MKPVAPPAADMAPFEVVQRLKEAPHHRMPNEFPEGALRHLFNHSLIEFQYDGADSGPEFVHLTELGLMVREDQLPSNLLNLRRPRKALPPAVRAALQTAFDRLVAGFLDWHETDSIDPGRPLSFSLGLDVEFPDGRGFGHHQKGSFQTEPERFGIGCREEGWWSHDDGSPILYDSAVEARNIMAGLQLLFPHRHYEVRPRISAPRATPRPLPEDPSRGPQNAPYTPFGVATPQSLSPEEAARVRPGFRPSPGGPQKEKSGKKGAGGPHT